MTNDSDQKRLGQLQAFAQILTTQRKEAINARAQSGVEKMWEEDDDYYNGIDDVNRSEYLKGATPSGSLTTINEKTSNRSTAFVNITQPYVDMASARVSDILLPTDDKPFRIKPTPIPEIVNVSKSNDMMPDGKITVGEAATKFIAEMTTKAQNAETQIWDWLCESRWHSEKRKVIEQTARLGTSVIKGPFPVKRKKRVVTKQEDGTIALKIEEVLKPASKQVDVRKLYPDPACGDNIHNGRYIFEYDTVSARQLRDLKGTGYIDSEIDEVLKEGPGKRNIETGKYEFVKDNELFEIWYYSGFAEPEDLRAANCECKDGSTLPVTVVMVNDRVIKATVSIMDSGEFPYDVLRWQYKSDCWYGTGVARQVRTAQKMVNAAARNLMDNAGVSSGPQILVRDGIVYPADGTWEITNLKIWRIDEGADIKQAEDAIATIIIPTLQNELQAIIKMALEFAERATNMPLLLQGQQGASTETVGGMQILNANASTVLRRVAKIADDDVTEPHILRYYEWLMIYGKDDSMKGDYTIEALGSTAFYERDAQSQVIMQMLPMANDPEFRLSKDRLMIEILKANKISQDRVRMTDDEWEALQKRIQENPPVDPRIAGAKEVAQIKVQGDLEKAKLVQTSDQKELQIKQQSVESEFALKLRLQELEFAHHEKIERMRYDIKMMELAQSQQVSVESIKAALASDVMKLKVQKELSMLNHSAKQVATPETEPVGQAAPGRAFQN